MGNLTGCFQQEVNPEHEANHIIIQDELAGRWVEYRANSNRDGLELAPVLPLTAAQHNAPILTALASIDAKTIRPLREGDAVRVAALDAQAAACVRSCARTDQCHSFRLRMPVRSAL
jgi:hypothetical protein